MDLAIDSRVDLVRRSTAERLAGFGLTPVIDIGKQQPLLRDRRAGCIVTERGRLAAVFGRWWPYLGNHLRAQWDRRFRGASGDRCELYYHVPLSASQFITLSYVHSSETCSLSTLYAASLVLDEIARIKGSAAIVCHVTNDRISDRFLTRWGWSAHCPDLHGRHFIKRFYGEFPDIPALWRTRLRM